MGYIDSGKEAGATLHYGGERHGDEGYFIKPTIFTDVHSDMKIVKEEIFGPVAASAIIKFKDEAEVVEMANNTTYGLAAYIFTQNVNRSIRVAHAVEAGTIGVCHRFFVLFLF
jgi:aldehyde dehydrogenase (NAD+)